MVEVEKMKKNYKLHNTNYKIQITNKVAHELHELTRIAGRDYTGKITTKGGHGLHQGSFKLQTMTALIKSFCGGPGGSFFKKRPLAAGGKTKKTGGQLCRE